MALCKTALPTNGRCCVRTRLGRSAPSALCRRMLHVGQEVKVQGQLLPAPVGEARAPSAPDVEKNLCAPDAPRPSKLQRCTDCVVQVLLQQERTGAQHRMNWQECHQIRVQPSLENERRHTLENGQHLGRGHHSETSCKGAKRGVGQRRQLARWSRKGADAEANMSVASFLSNLQKSISPNELKLQQTRRFLRASRHRPMLCSRSYLPQHTKHMKPPARTKRYGNQTHRHTHALFHLCTKHRDNSTIKYLETELSAAMAKNNRLSPTAAKFALHQQLLPGPSHFPELSPVQVPELGIGLWRVTPTCYRTKTCSGLGFRVAKIRGSQPHLFFGKY